MPDSIYLKGCPLCGHIAQLKQYCTDDRMSQQSDGSDYHAGLKEVKRKRSVAYIVECTRCKFKSFHYPSSVEAITAWNRRPDPRYRRAFPKGPWKYYPDKDGDFMVAQTNAHLELKKVLFKVVPDPSAHISSLSIEAMMRVITASQSMYNHLYETYNLLTELLTSEGENLNQKGDESRKLVTKLASLRADIELQLAGIDGASVSFDPNNDTPVLSRFGRNGNQTKPLKIAKIVQDDVPPPDFTIDNNNLNADDGEEEIEDGEEF